MNAIKRVLLALALSSASPVMAQYCFSGPPPGVLLGSGSDVVFPMQPIGFPFPLGGTTYSHIHVSDHGLVFLSNNGVPAPGGGPLLYTPSAVSFPSGAPMICVLWSDTIAPLPGMVHLDSTPVACTVTWTDVQSFGIPTPLFSLQMQLFPSGEVEFSWSVGATNNSTFGAISQVGIVGISPGSAPLSASRDLSAGGVTVDPMCYEEFPVANSFDMARSALRLIPMNPGWAFVRVLLGNGQCASSVDYGSGCGRRPETIYESFSTSTFDLANRTITWLRTPTGYAVVNTLPGAFVTPSAAAVNVAPGTVNGQQSFLLSAPMPVAGGLANTLNITTKGQIEVSGPPLPFVDFAPTVGKLVSWPNTIFSCWHHFDQTRLGSGLIKYEEVGGVAYATWDGVISSLGTLPSRFQFQFHLATGNVKLVFGATLGLNEVANADTIVVGSSTAGAAIDTGSTDLSAGLSTTLFDAGASSDELRLTTLGPPLLGNSSFGFQLSNVPPVVPIAVVYFGSLQISPGIDLTALNMPDCRAYTNANLTSAVLQTSGGSVLVSLPIPNSVGLIGVEFAVQGLAFSLVNQANLITSNGTLMHVGL